MTTIQFVEGIAAVVMLLSVCGVLWTRWNKGIGERAIQFVVVSVGLPVILILALEKVIPAAVTGTLLGAIVGILSTRLRTNDDKKKTRRDTGP